MPHVIVAGVPQKRASRFEHYLKGSSSVLRSGWEVKVQKGLKKTTDPDVEALRDALQSDTWGGAHVLSFGDQGTRKQVVRDLVPYARLRWLRGDTLWYVQAQDFASAASQLNLDLEAEEIWADRLRPVHPRDALLLPEQSFSHGPNGGIWSAAETVTDKGRIDAVARKIDAFKAHHFVDVPGKGRRWVDARGLVFDHVGEEHGLAALSRQWKYAFRIPDGFHYDVSSKDGRAFSVADHVGASHPRRAGEHANVDPFGYIR